MISHVQFFMTPHTPSRGSARKNPLPHLPPSLSMSLALFAKPEIVSCKIGLWEKFLPAIRWPFGRPAPMVWCRPRTTTAAVARRKFLFQGLVPLSSAGGRRRPTSCAPTSSPEPFCHSACLRGSRRFRCRRLNEGRSRKFIGGFACDPQKFLMLRPTSTYSSISQSTFCSGAESASAALVRA
jgi:hypothetical protein